MPTISAISSAWSVVADMVSQQPIGPTKPEVPIPAPAALFFMCRMQVEIGPSIAEASVGASHTMGLRAMFPIWSMEVPRPCEIRPPQPFSLKLITAKPTICAQHPAVAAPAAKPLIPIEIHNAAELMGSVRMQPTDTATTTPIAKGFSSVARFINSPNDITHSPIGTHIYCATRPPATMVTRGVMMMSTGVRFDTSEPISIATIVARYAPMGLPPTSPAGPPSV